jgi:hypothetical protein
VVLIILTVIKLPPIVYLFCKWFRFWLVFLIVVFALLAFFTSLAGKHNTAACFKVKGDSPVMGVV